jgi:hypothetical protein
MYLTHGKFTLLQDKRLTDPLHITNNCNRLHRMLPNPASQNCQKWFRGVLLLLLLLFTLAAVHECIPGLCSADEDASQPCPFCKLMQTLYFLAFLATCMFHYEPARSGILRFANPPTPKFPYPFFLLRAPPA